MVVVVVVTIAGGCAGSKTPPKDDRQAAKEEQSNLEVGGSPVTEDPELIKESPSSRGWTSKSGRLLARGDFISLEDDQVRVRLSTGEMGRIALDKLSDGDQQYVRDQSATDGGERFEIESIVDRKEKSTADATHAAWISFFETTLGTQPRREGEAESTRMGRELITLTRIPLEDVDPQLAKVIRELIEVQESRIEKVRVHEAEIAECDESWRRKFAEAGNRVSGIASQAGNLDDAARAATALSFLGNAVLTQQRNAEVAAMNEKWAGVYASFDAKSKPLFQRLRTLAPVLEKRYGRKFLLP